jgi:8-oxo-dGTP pyrophosphatase MutT (NUDIX family)
MRTIERKIAVALILSADGKIFQGQKDPKKGGVYSDGYWHIPGGGIESGETTEHALIREVKEEIGLDITHIPFTLVDDTGTGESEKMLPTGENVRVKMKFYRYKIILPTKAESTKIELSDDLWKYKWVKPEELKTLKLTPPSVELFKKLGYL